MFNNARLKRVFAISILLVLALSTFAIAANGVYEKAVTAVLGRIKFKVDGKDVTKEIESKYGSPAFVVKEYGSRAYVPVRAIAELMGLEIEWDAETHTAEIIDAKSEKYEKELEKKDKEIAELKKEIEKLKKNVVEETDLEALEKDLNKEFGTYEDVDFEITLKESKNRITVDITMDLRDGRQESAWLRMKHSDRKALIEDIVDIISSEFTNVDIYGSIYDEFYRRDEMTFNKKKNSSKVSISYDSRVSDTYDRYYDRYIDDEINYEFEKKGIEDAYLRSIDFSGRTIYFEIGFSSDYKGQWDNTDNDDIRKMLDRIANEIAYYYDDYYYDGYYDDYYYDYAVGDIFMGSKRVGEYDRDLYRTYGKFIRIN